MAIAFQKDTKTLVAILAIILLVPLTLFIALIWPSDSPETISLKKISTTSSSTPPGKVASAEALTTTSSSTSSTTTSQPSTTTTTAPVFSATATATKTNEVITQCVSDQYTFSGSISANIPGTVTWSWVRWDGTPTGISGSSTFTSNGTTTDSVAPYTFSLGPSQDLTGWVALELSWNDGSASSPQASFIYSNAAVNSGIVPGNIIFTGC